LKQEVLARDVDSGDRRESSGDMSHSYLCTIVSNFLHLAACLQNNTRADLQFPSTGTFSDKVLQWSMTSHSSTRYIELFTREIKLHQAIRAVINQR
jgi:hypothetical protein